MLPLCYRIFMQSDIYVYNPHPYLFSFSSISFVISYLVVESFEPPSSNKWHTINLVPRAFARLIGSDDDY
jgi:hypothetical protein